MKNKMRTKLLHNLLFVCCFSFLYIILLLIFAVEHEKKLQASSLRCRF